jgi:hypothetical protein
MKLQVIKKKILQIKFLEPQKCTVLCTKNYTGGEKASLKNLQHLKKGMSLNYQHHWIVGKTCISCLDVSLETLSSSFRQHARDLVLSAE